jgi:putative DNA primase/helicase
MPTAEVLKSRETLRKVAPMIKLDAPFEAARAIVATKYQRGPDRTLVYWQGEFYVWTGSHYSLTPTPDIREMLYHTAAETADKAPKKRNVDELLDALKAAANLSDLTRPPAYLREETGDRCPRTFIPMANGILVPDTDELLPATPRLFATYALPFAFNRLAAPPVSWTSFLADLWPGDQESIDLLQEWMGYLLTPKTEQQKAMMLIGPKRGGKGTIARIIGAMLGDQNYCSPTLGSLGTHFGLQSLIGKLLAVVSDARLGGHADICAIVENLLRITGEDAISIARKFMPDYTARLPTRIMVLTNELPRFTDGSGALPSRFLILRLTRSFYDAEDHGLESRLMAELPSILNWALTGLDRLTYRGRFVQPSAATEMVEELELLASPVRAFLADECIVEAGASIAASNLFDAFTEWCRVNGRDHTGTAQTFGRDLRSALPNLKITQPRQAGNRGRHYEGVRVRRISDG